MWYCGLVTRPPHELNDPAVQARIVEMALAGASIRAIATELGYDRKTLARRRDRPDEFGRLLTTALRSARQAQAEASPPKPPPKPKGPPKPCQVGRPSRLNDPGIQAQIVAMTLAGQSLPKIAAVLGCSSKALTRAQQRMPAFRDKVEAARKASFNARHAVPEPSPEEQVIVAERLERLKPERWWAGATPTTEEFEAYLARLVGDPGDKQRPLAIRELAALHRARIRVDAPEAPSKDVPEADDAPKAEQPRGLVVVALPDDGSTADPLPTSIKLDVG
jgi:transposase-like protein